MALIKTNHKEAQTFENLPAGTYEVIIEAGAVKTTAAGSPMINWKLNVRDDVEGQSHGGRKVFTNTVIQENTMGMVQAFLLAINAPEGMEFDTAEDLRDYAVGKAVRVRVGLQIYKGEERNEVKGFLPTEVGGGVVDDPFAAGNKAPIEVSEDDLPF